MWRREKGTLKSANRLLDPLQGDRQRQANVAGTSEAGAGNGKHAFLRKPPGKRNVVGDGGSEKDVERAFGPAHLVSNGVEGIAKHVALVLVGQRVDLPRQAIPASPTARWRAR